MGLDWSGYNAYFQSGKWQQQPMDELERGGIEAWAVDLLQVQDRAGNWGCCSAPGVFSYTVIQIPQTIRHRYSDVAPGMDIGVKIVKAGPGPSPESIVHFQKVLRPRVPGLPHPLVQEVYDAGELAGRHFVVQEWIHGETLDRRLASQVPLTQIEARGFLTDYFIETMLPLWSAGCIYWDHRPANLVVAERHGRCRLVMIDTDSLAACAKEMAESPGDFTHRDRVKVSRGLARIKTMIKSIHEANLKGEDIPRSERSARRQAMDEAIQSVLDVLRLPGLPVNDPQLFDSVLRCL